MNTTLLAITSSDERLWRDVVNGDASAFQTVVERYQGAVAGVAFNIVGEFTASQDVAQETFWAAWKSRSQLREPGKLGGWLCGIARNLGNDWVRKHRDSTVNDDSELVSTSSREMDPLEQSISTEEQKQVWSSLEALPHHYREVLVLFYRQGRSIAEVAVTLELSEDAVKQRLSRGREMLREQLATVIEDVLVRSRPGRSFTTRVMAGLIGMGAALGSSGAASAATVGSKLAGGAISGAAATATKSLLATSAGAGIAGGLAGTAGGLAGAWLGTWLPAQLAPTLTERKLLEANGRFLFRISLAYTIFILCLTSLLFVGAQWSYFLIVGCTTIAFVIFTIIASLRIQRRIKEIRATIRPEDDPNPSSVKTRLETMGGVGKSGWKGRRYTSRVQFLGLPLLDIQVADPDFNQFGLRQPRSVARGWIAIGDRANGVLLGIGGLARGLIAVGGVAYGVIALGGLSIGLFSLGGMAIGLLAVGGGALGHTAIGGGACGWDVAGGLAIGWDSASGGLAIAKHVAFGGLAVASEFAVGGQAYAEQVNTIAAQQAVSADSLKWLLDWYLRNQILALVVIIGISLAPIALLPTLYRRGPSADELQTK